MGDSSGKKRAAAVAAIRAGKTRVKPVVATDAFVEAFGPVPRLGECKLTRDPRFDKTLTVRCQAVDETGYMTIKTIVDVLESLGCKVTLPEKLQ